MAISKQKKVEGSCKFGKELERSGRAGMCLVLSIRLKISCAYEYTQLDKHTHAQ